MAQRYASKLKDLGLNGYHIQALIQTQKLTGLTVAKIGDSIDGVTRATINNVIGKRRQFTLGLPLAEAILDVLERNTPGAKLYYHLLLLGLSPDEAQAKVFDKSLRPVVNLNLSDIAKSKASYDLEKSALNTVPQVDAQKLVNNLDSTTVIALFKACLARPGFFKLLSQQPNAFVLAEKLIQKCINVVGARPEKVGANLSYSAFGKLMQGFSPNLLSNSTKGSDAKSLENKSTVVSPKQKKSRSSK